MSHYDTGIQNSGLYLFHEVFNVILKFGISCNNEGCAILTLTFHLIVIQKKEREREKEIH